MPLRALGVDGGDSFDVIQAVRFAAGLSNSSGTVPAQCRYEAPLTSMVAPVA